MDIETTAEAFVFTFWIGVAAESSIRWAENTQTIAILSKPLNPKAKGDNQDFRLRKAWGIMLSLFAIVATYMFLVSQMPDVFALEPTKKFTGQNGGRSSMVTLSMAQNWVEILRDPKFTIPLLIGAVFRAAIYKRNPKSPEEQRLR